MNDIMDVRTGSGRDTAINENRQVIPCEVIRDILPLYHDRICSEQSRSLVETHLKTCAGCRQILAALDEEKFEKELRIETKEILQRHRKKERSLAFKTGIFLAGILILPVIIAVILTLPGYSDWKTNAVLIASMLLAAGMTVVPVISEKKKFSKAVIFSTSALLLVIFFVEMFFDNGGLLRFGEIASSTVFGISLFLFPFVLRQAELPEALRNHKGLLTMNWDTLWFYLMLFLFALDYPEALPDLISVSSFFAAAAWLIFLTARYARVNRWIKSGIIVMITGIWTAVGSALGWLSVTDYDVHTEILICSLAVGVLLAGIGILITNRWRNKQ